MGREPSSSPQQPQEPPSAQQPDKVETKEKKEDDFVVPELPRGQFSLWYFINLNISLCGLYPR